MNAKEKDNYKITPIGQWSGCLILLSVVACEGRWVRRRFAESRVAFCLSAVMSFAELFPCLLWITLLYVVSLSESVL
ncbi:hypothetical protein VNO77_21673 [Canavalia gladiata]|uniref:Uncharacterized protein n=1 Tax=Canavalia gladiata TaxID=3824 RepID=A0AAN9QMC6_CANGL